MIKKHLFKTVKALTAAAIVAVGAMTGAGLIGKADNSSGMITAYAFDHQSYSDSTGYILRLDGDVWHCYNSDNQIDYSYDGLAQNEYGWWKVNNGEVDFCFDGLALNEYGWWKVSGGAVDFSYSGMAENEYGWWYVSNGAVDFSYTGLSFNQYGWWYLSNGTVDFSYSGLVSNEYGWWKVTNGTVDFNYTGLTFDETVGWWYVSGGCIDFGYSGVVQNEYGWWKVTDGTVDFTYSGLASNENGEWVIRDGQVDFDYNGEYEGKTVEGGCVVGSGNTGINPSPSEPETPAEKLNGLIYNEEADKWSYYVDGNVDTDNNGLVEYNGGWFKLNNGVVDFTYNGLAENNGYWFKISGGVVDFSYNGLAEYNGGLFKIAGGLLDNEYTGTYYNDGTYYYVDKGTVKSSAPEGTQEAELLAINKFVFDEIFSSRPIDGEICPTYDYGNGGVTIWFKNHKRGSVSIDSELIDTYGFDSFSTFDNIINTIASIN